MGTWGDGLYDNDSALDDLARLLKIDDDVTDIIDLTTRIGLAAWLNPVAVCYMTEELNARVEALSKEFDRVPEETLDTLETLLEDPDSVTKEGSRKPEAASVIGGYSDGPLLDPLLRFPGAKPIIDAFGEAMAQKLDYALAPRGQTDLNEAARSLAPLGVLVELAMAGFHQPARARVEQWREHFAIIDKATKSERGFWWKYVRRVQAGFDILAPRPHSTAPAQPAKSIANRPEKLAKSTEHPTQWPVERYQHSKFGMGTLMGRSGSGDDEKLEIRFGDGSIRKILAKFVSRVDD